MTSLGDKPAFVLVRDYGSEGLSVCGVTFDQSIANAWIVGGLSGGGAVCVARPEQLDGRVIEPVSTADALIAELERTR